ncbi:ABC transporter permease [Romboutsia sedimentorum]|uniref:ABC transporter permease n=1 Tax=Romboutsia sedimentorum TaxID=1368474 RepID=A0ABT7EBL8_9FIRM|nr:ABC transporter permease [Romboutsia sedimentorum]MDK2564332.1 ABC transporter permease [Romboutsia sedimentorum]
MNFSTIIRKNLIHNLKKYLSMYFINTVVVAMLFMYGSLIFNSTVINQKLKTSLYSNIHIALLGLILFSVVFITYSNFSFLKYRGKEFGIYFTLGMTSKDLSKLLFAENLSVLLLSIVSGIISGSIFSRLFYMGINKILVSNPVKFELSIESLLLTLCIFVIIFLCNNIFSIIYIKKLLIIDLFKCQSKKEASKNNVILGFIAIPVLIISSYCFPKVLLYYDSYIKIYYESILIVLMLICIYVSIGSSLDIIKFIIKKFPQTYNNNILVLSSLYHRFLGFKSTIYIVSILIAGAVFFSGITYSIYVMTRSEIDVRNPYDILFIESDKFNKVKKNEIIDLIKSSGSKIQKYSGFEYIDILEYRYKNGKLNLWRDNSSIISESNYNRHMNSKLDIKKGEAVNVSSLKQEYKFDFPDTVLAIDKDKKILKLKKSKIKEVEEPFTNVWLSSEFYSGNAFVLNDDDYNIIKNDASKSKIKKQHLIKGDINETTFNLLLSKLRDINKLDKSYWREAVIDSNMIGDKRGVKEAYKPIYKKQQINLEIENNAMAFFTMGFIGILFTVTSGIVLYYKVLSDIEDDTQRLISLNRIGITDKEIINIITKEMAITFTLPMLVGGGIGFYLLYIVNSISPRVEALMEKCVLIFLIYLLIYVVLYLISRKKYIFEIKNRI